jgi:GcrA cell cycle regulator
MPSAPRRVVATEQSAPSPMTASASPHAPPSLPAYRDEQPGSATVLTLGAHMCKWPIGDPSSDGFTFCGRRSSDGPYCVEHARVAYQPQQSKKKAGPTELARSLRRYI